MRLPGRASLAAFVVMVTTTTFFCRDGGHHDIQIGQAVSRAPGISNNHYYYVS